MVSQCKLVSRRGLRKRRSRRPSDTGSLCLAVNSTHTTVPGLFRLLVRRSGTHCQMNSEIRRVMSTASNSSLKQSCSAPTSVTSALEVIFNVMRSISPRFTLLYFTYGSGGSVFYCLRCALQCWRRSYGRVRDAQYCAGTDEVRGCSRHVSDGQDALHATTSHGSNRGTQHRSVILFLRSIIFICAQRSTIPTVSLSVVRPCGTVYRLHFD